MIDLSKITYRVAAIGTDGRQSDIRDYIENLGWEENENEISMRLSFTARNDPTCRGYLSNIINPGCLVGVFATDGRTFDEEVARGYVETWNPILQNGADHVKFTCYDELYSLQKSQDNIYLPAGTGTRSAVTGILGDWGIALESYRGPDVAHAKQKFSNRYLSDMVLELLDDAVKKGGHKSIIRAARGRVSILPLGSNSPVYVLRVDSMKSVSQTVSTADLITRVKVIGQADDEGNSSVEATLNGLTQYGIRQRIYTRGSDEDLSAAQSAAQEILNENGTIKKRFTVEAPDVPFIRKGDVVHMAVWLVSAYYHVKSISHDASTGSMSMVLEQAQEEIVQENSVAAAKGYKVGDVVNFHGGTHYVSSYSGAKGYAARAGRARITKMNGSGKTHPWHLIHEDGSSNVYGWVDDGTFD